MKLLTELESACAGILRVPSHLPDAKRRGIMHVRLHAFGHSIPCSRCGGCGNYSYNQVDGSRCYGCGGSGGKAPKITKALLAKVQASVNTGALEDYLAQVRTIQNARLASDRVMRAWGDSGVSKAYDWMKASQKIEPDLSISNNINKPMCQAYERVKAFSDQLTSIAFRLRNAATAEERTQLEVERLEVARRTMEEANQAVEVIRELAARIPEVKQAALERTRRESRKGDAEPLMK